MMSLLRLPTLALVCASVAGLLTLRGTWVAWQAPTDVPISVNDAFESHRESFWWQKIKSLLASWVLVFERLD